MKRLIRTTLIATTATTALLLTACGGSDDSSGEEIEGVDEGGNDQEQQEETEEPQQTPDGVERPEIVLPDGFENVWEDWESDDTTKQAILHDVREAQNAVDLAIMERDPEADYVSFYHSAEALVGAKDWINEFIDNDGTVSGTVRYFNPVVSLQDDSGATVTYCADESEATAVDVNSGEQLSEDTGRPYVWYSSLLKKDDQGVWMTTVVQSERRAECS
ncbi:hypothetical protein [Streptomyces sp. 6N223]|uniref:hypothetical protein n=1 Tax=Streptomyces sp. 6N223 TaxID=3457412 RepID=UPI003FD1E3F4